MKTLTWSTLISLVIAAPSAIAQHDQHQADVNRRGDAVMGFSQQSTTHHFTLRADGGDIDVTVNRASDSDSASQIGGHLRHIREMFAAGDFTAPMLIHSQDPPGTAVMVRLRAEITYTVEPLRDGSRLRMTTTNREALAAIHEFLRFQITDHRTGDPLTIQRR